MNDLGVDPLQKSIQPGGIFLRWISEASIEKLMTLEPAAPQVTAQPEHLEADHPDAVNQHDRLTHRATLRASILSPEARVPCSTRRGRIGHPFEYRMPVGV
jgi:hypothetical protein